MAANAATESAQLLLRCSEREREWEMARKTSGRRGAAIIALIAALAALTGPGVASASNGKGAAAPAAPAAAAVAVSYVGVVASWAEDASWAEE